MYDTNDDKTDRCEYSIHEGNNGLSFENDSKASSDFPSNDSPFIIEKLEISIPYLTEKLFDFESFDQEKIR